MMNTMISSIAPPESGILKRTYNDPPLPPRKKRDSGGDDDRRLEAILKWKGKSYIVECRSRKLTPNFCFRNEELGEVVYHEDGITQLYSQKQLDPEIYSFFIRTIKAWEMQWPDF